MKTKTFIIINSIRVAYLLEPFGLYVLYAQFDKQGKELQEQVENAPLLLSEKETRQTIQSSPFIKDDVKKFFSEHWVQRKSESEYSDFV
jgi:hypothetical protein